MRYVIREKETFSWGRLNQEQAASEAKACPLFAEDSPEECVSDCRLSCLNCRYRRWTRKSYVCLKKAVKKKRPTATAEQGGRMID